MRCAEGAANGGGQRQVLPWATLFCRVQRPGDEQKALYFRASAFGMVLAPVCHETGRGGAWPGGVCAMLFAGLAASAAFDLLSLLNPDKPSGKSGTGAATPSPSSFKVADLDAALGTGTESKTSSSGRGSGLSRDALDTLLSTQGQAQAQRKKRSASVLLDLLKSSQDGKVKKSDFEAAAGADDSKASELFDAIDQDKDASVNTAELTAFLDTYRRASESASLQGKARSLAMVA
jgi:hypothetical protein